MKRAYELVGGSPDPVLRPVSLAVKRHLERYEPQAVVVGVSGGPDSVALAVAALAVAGRPPVHTVTVDHGIREGAKEEAQRVAALMEGLGADSARVCSVTVRGGEGPARDARIEALESQASELGPGAEILLGHTMDDQAETVLLRLARGASTRALAAMRVRRRSHYESRERGEERRGSERSDLWLGRPLLGVRRSDTVAFCEALGLPTVDDPTNYMDGPWTAADGDPLRRAAVRALALPALNRALNQDVVPALARIATQAAEDEDALVGMIPSSLTGQEGDASGLGAVRVLDLSELAGLPAAVRRRVLREAASSAGASQLNHAQMDQMDALVTGWHGQGPVHLPGGVRAWREGKGIHVQQTE